MPGARTFLYQAGCTIRRPEIHKKRATQPAPGDEKKTGQAAESQKTSHLGWRRSDVPRGRPGKGTAKNQKGAGKREEKNTKKKRIIRGQKKKVCGAGVGTLKTQKMPNGPEM